MLADLRSPQPKSDFIEKIGILFFSFGIWSFREIAILGLLLMLTSAVISWKQTAGALMRSPTGILSLALIVYITLSTAIFSIKFEEYAPFMLNGGLRHIYLFGFLFFALALRRQQGYLWPAIMLAIVGFFIGRLPYIPDLINSSAQWWAVRSSLGFPTAIPMGEYAFTVVLGLIIFIPRLAPKRNPVSLAIWFILLALVTQAVLISQTRSVWLAAPFFIAFTVYMSLRLHLLRPRSVAGLAAAILVISLAAAFTQYKLIQGRLFTEPGTWNQLIQGDIHAIPSTTESGEVMSIGMRVNMMEFGLEKWTERPLFGWGPGASKMLIHCCAPGSFKRFNDLHSAYLEALLRFGLVGSLLGIALVLFLVRDAIKAMQRGVLPNDIFLFVIVGLALHLVVAIANYRVVNYDWRFYWIFFSGIAMAFSPYIRIDRNTADNKTGKEHQAVPTHNS